MNSVISKRLHHKLSKPWQWIACRAGTPIVPLSFAFLFFALSGLLASVNPAFSYDDKSFLWKVQSSRSTVYLLGSIHFLKEDAYPLNQTIEEAYEASDKLAVEANINELGNLNLNALADNAFYKGDDQIQKHVAPETYRLITKESKTLGMPIELIRMQKPWFLALSFQAMELVRLGYSPQHGVDYHFLTKAKGKKKILELESLDEQLALLSGFSDREQEEFLLYTLNTLSSMESQVDSLVRAWKSGNVKGMESIISDTAAQDGSIAALFRKLFDERNIKMASTIQGYLTSGGTYFVIVGAGHLIGERGVVELLKAKGYEVEQL